MSDRIERAADVAGDWLREKQRVAAGSGMRGPVRNMNPCHARGDEMATFKVGQRVRVVAIRPEDRGTVCRAGDTGTIASALIASRFGHEWGVEVDRLSNVYNFCSHELAPLTDPKAEEFIERLKKMKVYDELTVKTRVTEGIQ